MDDLTVSNREIKILSKRIVKELLQDPHFLNEVLNFKEIIGSLSKDNDFLKSLGTGVSRFRQLFQKLQNSEQFVKTFTSIKDPKTLAQSLQGILTINKINNPQLNLKTVPGILSTELKKDLETIDKVVDQFREKTQQEVEKEEEGKEVSTVGKQKIESDRGLVSTTGATGTTGTVSTSVTESLLAREKYLSEKFARKLRSKLILK